MRVQLQYSQRPIPIQGKRCISMTLLLAVTALMVWSPSAGKTHYVDNASDCSLGIGVQECVDCDDITCGPLKNVNAAVQFAPKLVAGDFMIKAGFYPERVILNTPMVIRAYDGPAVIGDVNPAPFDLVWDAVDDNGFPLNPKWGAQAANSTLLPDPKLCDSYFAQDPGDSPCTHQSTSRDQGFFDCGPHVNWFGCTYTGSVTWIGHSCEGCDQDYQLNLFPDNKGGLTKNNKDSIELEFDSAETIDRFGTPSWWSVFHVAVDWDGCLGCGGIQDRGNCDMISHGGCLSKYLINEGSPARAIVTGLMGLDCGHSCQSELHPVWAMAMDVTTSASEDRWAFFVRNWGNEGYCGFGQHTTSFPNNQYKLRLPWNGDAGSASTKFVSLHHHNTKDTPAPVVCLVKNEAVVVTFTLDPPVHVGGVPGFAGDGPMWDGEISVQWLASDNSNTPPPCM